MRWKPHKLADIAAHTIVSNEGYVVIRCTANGIPTGRFVAFRVLLEKRVVLGGYDTAEDAKQACEAHRSQVTEAA